MDRLMRRATLLVRVLATAALRPVLVSVLTMPWAMRSLTLRRSCSRTTGFSSLSSPSSPSSSLGTDKTENKCTRFQCQAAHGTEE